MPKALSAQEGAQKGKIATKRCFFAKKRLKTAIFYGFYRKLLTSQQNKTVFDLLLNRCVEDVAPYNARRAIHAVGDS